MIANGTFKARPVSAVLQEGKNGNPPLVVQFDILHPDLEGETILHYLYFDVKQKPGEDHAEHRARAKKMAVRSVEVLRTCGYMGSDITNVNFPPSAIVELVIEQETYEGKVRPRVKFVNKPGAGLNAKKLNGKEADDLKNKLKAIFSLHDAKNPPPPPANDEPPPIGDDDIPF